MTTVGDLLGASLAAAGVRVTFGPVPLAGLPHERVDDADLAALLADADGRIGPGPGVAFDGRHLRLSSRPGGEDHAPATLDEAQRVAATIEPATRAVRNAATTRMIEVSVDLGAAINPRARPSRPVDYLPFAGAVLPAHGDARVAMLVGPGVVRRGGVEGLRAFAAAGQLPVANTWGAKGVFTWDSPHHMGTCGLQADDFALLGFGDLDLLITAGLDRDEANEQLLDSVTRKRVDVAPEQLGDLARLVAGNRHLDAANALYTRLAAVAQPGYADDRFPMHPARAVAQLAAARPTGGIIAADPGAVGLWVARTFSTTELASVIVPASTAPGIAAAVAFCARRRGLPAAAVTRAPLDAATEAVCALADARGLGFPLFVWDDGRDPTGLTSIAAHESAAARVGAAAAMTAVERFVVPIDWTCTDALVTAAGSVVAWQS